MKSQEQIDAEKLIDEAIAESKISGWTLSLKEKALTGIAMIDNCVYGNQTILQNIFLRAEWDRYSPQLKWEDYVNQEFKENFPNEVI